MYQVIHLASPFVLDSKDYEKDLYVPAVNGTESILKAVKEHNQSVKRVVITSSFAAVEDFPMGRRPGYIYTEEDWNPMTTEEAKKAGPAAAYLVSKTLAERAAYDFVKSEKPDFSITTLNPPMVYGPLLQDVESMSKLNTSSADIYRLFNGSSKEVPDTSFWACIDVRDGKPHLLARTVLMAHADGYLSEQSQRPTSLHTKLTQLPISDISSLAGLLVTNSSVILSERISQSSEQQHQKELLTSLYRTCINWILQKLREI